MAAVVVELSGDEAKLLKAYQRVRDSQDKMDGSLKQVKASSEKAGKAGERAGQQMQESFGGRALTQVKNYATGLMAVSTAANFIQDAMRAAREETLGAMAATEQLTASRMRLLQVQQGPEDRQRMEDLADRLARDSGISRDEARQLMFSARSEGFESAMPMIARLGGAGVVSVPAASTVAGQVPGLLPGSGLTAEQALNATYVSAQQSRLGFEQMSQALPIVAEGMSLVGASPAETFALPAALASRFKSGETAGDRIKALAGEINMREDLRGRGVLAVVDELAAGTQEQRDAFLGGNKEVRAAYQMIVQERAVIAERERQVQQAIDATGTAASPLAMAEQVAFDTSTPAGRLNQMRVDAERAKIATEIERENQLAAAGFSAQAAYSRMEAAQSRRRTDFVSRYSSRLAMGAVQDSGLGAGAVTAAGYAGEGATWTGSAAGSSANAGMAWAAQLLGRSAEQLNNASRSLQDNADQQARQRAAVSGVPE